MFTGIDLSTLPPACIWCVVVIYVVCAVLPDVIGPAGGRGTSRAARRGVGIVAAPKRMSRAL